MPSTRVIAILMSLWLCVGAVLASSAEQAGSESGSVSGTRLRAVNTTFPWVDWRSRTASRTARSSPSPSSSTSSSDSAEDTLQQKLGQSAEREDSAGWSLRLAQAAMAVLKECSPVSDPSPGSTSTRTPTSCFKAVVLRALDRLSRTHREVPLGAGLVLVPDNAVLDKSPSANKGSLDDALEDRFASLLKSYSVRLQLPSARAIRDVMDGEGEGQGLDVASSARKRTGLGPLLFLGSSLLPVKMSLLALLVGKALMLSTLAFAIPAMRLLQSGAATAAAGGGHCH